MGGPVVRHLLTRSAFALRVFTRDTESARAEALLRDGGGRVAVVQGNVDDEASLRDAMRGIDAVFCNTDFWSSGSPLQEYEQGLRVLSAACDAQVRHFIWSSLDNAVGLTDGVCPVPHFDSKAAVEHWIDLMRSEEFMRRDARGWFSSNVSVLVTAPYFENFQFRLLPKPGRLTDGRDGLIFNIALGNGRYPLIALDDIAWFAAHIFDHPERFAGRTLRVLGEALSGDDIAATFERVTGIPAEYCDLPLDDIRAAMPDTGHDVAGMFAFYQTCDVMGRAPRHAGLAADTPRSARFCRLDREEGVARRSRRRPEIRRADPVQARG